MIRWDYSALVDPRMVGLGGLEPPTSRLSSARSNQLSYKPVAEYLLYSELNGAVQVVFERNFYLCIIKETYSEFF